MPTPGELALKFRNRWMDYNINYFGEVPEHPQPPPPPRNRIPLRRKSQKVPVPEDSDTSDEDSPPKKSMDPWCCRRPPKPSRRNCKVPHSCKDRPPQLKEETEGKGKAAKKVKYLDEDEEAPDVVLDVEEVSSI
mmetsp:Transcript_96484/g.210983  ORF Transcript_96484/g.210983 Transcript_96484/m.210983 type:complete len:134 (-) Transcript_96484:282-683(-)